MGSEGAHVADYNLSAFPVSYADPAYDAADKSAAAALGIPDGWLPSIRTKGEKSNADQVSSAGARTPYQITAPTRQAIIDQTGVDPWLNPQTAAYGAAYLLKQSLDRNGGNPILATAEYHGGTDRAAWGNKTMAYVKRVTGATPNTADAVPSFAQGDAANPYQLAPAPDTSNLGVGMPNANAPSLAKVFDAYKKGIMAPEDAAAFETDVRAGKILLPRGMELNAPKDEAAPASAQGIPATGAPPAGAPGAQLGADGQPMPQSAAQVLQIPQGAVDAFNSGKMPPDVRALMQSDIQAGRAQLPSGAKLVDPNAPPPSQGFLGDLGRQLGLTARDVVQGAGNTVGLAYDPIAGILNGIGSLVGHDPNIPALGDQAKALADQLGLPQPVGTLERLVNAGAQGAAEAAGFAGAGRAVAELPGIIGQLGKVFGADAGKQVAAMAAGQAAAQSAKDAGASPAVQAALNLGTTLLTFGGAHALEAAAHRASPVVTDLAQRLYTGAKGDAGAGAAEAAQGATEGAEGVAAASPTAAPRGVPTPEAAAGSAAPPAAASLDPSAFLSAADLAEQTRRAVGAEGVSRFGLGKDTAREVLATQGAADPENLAAAQRLGVVEDLQPDHLTSNQAYRELAQAIKSTPGSLARADEMEGLRRVGERATKLIEDAGGSRDLSDMNAQVKADLMGTQQQLDQRADALYGQIRDSVDQRMPVQAPNVLGFINQRMADLGGFKNLSGMEKMIAAKLTPKTQMVDQAVQKLGPAGMPTTVTESVRAPKNPTYALLDDVRRDIGDGLKNKGPFKDAGQGLLKALYARISDDQRAALTNVPGALETFDAARAAVQMRKSVEDDMVSLFGKQLADSLVPKLETSVKALSAGDEAKYLKIMQAVPASQRQAVTASALNRAFGRATANGDLNFKAFADWMDGLKKNSQAFNAVMGNLPPDTRRQLLDLAKVSRGISNATREYIATGRIMAARQELMGAKADSLMEKVMEKAGATAAGASVAGAAHVAGPVGAGLAHALGSLLERGKPDVMKAADELIVSPEFVNLAKSAEAPTGASASSIKAAANSPQMRRFFDLAKAPSAANDSNAREAWLRGALTTAESEHNMNTNR